MEISDFVKKDICLMDGKEGHIPGTVKVTGIVKGLQEVFLDTSSEKDNQGVMHYTAFLIDPDNNKNKVLIQGSLDSYLGDPRNLRVLSMLRASSELNEPLTIRGPIQGENKTYIFVGQVLFGEYDSEQEL